MSALKKINVQISYLNRCVLLVSTQMFFPMKQTDVLKKVKKNATLFLSN